MGIVLSVQVAMVRGIEKQEVQQVKAVKNWGLENDAHAGTGDRQVSIFPIEALARVPLEKKIEVNTGLYTENITISGIPLEQLSVNRQIRIGDETIIQIKHIGKEVYKEHNRSYIISREGRFGVVLRDGIIRKNDRVELV